MTIQLRRREFLQISAAGIAFCGHGRACERFDDAPVDARRDVQLFLDDWLIASSSGINRVVHKPRKQGLIQEADGSPWQRGDAPAVVRDRRGRFHIYYRLIWEDPSVRDLHPGIGNDKAHWFRRTVGYAVSDDGIRWTKPVLGLFDGPTGFRPAPREKWADGVFTEPVGFSRTNNLGCPVNHVQDLGQFGGVSDPQRRFLVNVLHRSDSHNFADITDAGLYFAADVPDIVGNPDWRKQMTPVWEGPRRGPRGEETRVAGYSTEADEWFVNTQSRFGTFAGTETGRTISRFASRDLIKWTDEEPILKPTDDEPRLPKDWVEYMGIEVFRAGSVWLGQLVIFHSDRTSEQYQMPDPKTGRPNGVWRKGTTDVQLMVSRDAGHKWQRVGPREAWIPHHDADDGVDRLVFGGSPVRVDDELWLYYMCFDGDHLVWKLDGTTYYRNRTRIGRVARATLRWNGFASLRPVDRKATIVTRPLFSDGRRLVVNSTASRGNVRVALIGSDGTPLAGYSLADCQPLTGDGVAQPVRWNGQPNVPNSSFDNPLRLHIELESADLFGFEFLD